MKKILIGADHRGFFLKEKIKKYLSEKYKYRLIDVGNYFYDIEDDYPDFAKALAEKFDKNSLGILICGSGVGVSIVANKFKGIRCGICFDERQAKAAKEEDNINVLALPADFVSFQKAKKIINEFLKSKFKRKEKYIRRIKKINQIEELLFR
jgi:ribose 5-phosphate isomerase B